MNAESVYALLGTGWRKKRMEMFAAMFVRSRLVVDLVGTPRNWTWACSFDVTLVNLDQGQGNRGIDFVCANALRCPFRDRAFEVVFSNSLIEHIGTWEEQRQFAVEIRRLAGRYFIQTPNRWFPIEPHCLAPLVQFVPRRVRPWVAAWLTPAGWLVPSRQQFQREMQPVRLLTAKEMRKLFPEARIVREKFLGMTKSLIAISG